MDTNGIRKFIKDYETRRKNDLKAFKYKTNALNYVKPLSLKDDIYKKYITDIIISKELKFDGDKLTGDDNIVNQFRENYSDTFKSADMGELISDWQLPYLNRLSAK